MTLTQQPEIENLPEELRDFAKQDNPNKSSTKTILHRAAEEIEQVRQLHHETLQILANYHKSTQMWDELIPENQLRSEWLKTTLPTLISDIDPNLWAAACTHLMKTTKR